MFLSHNVRYPIEFDGQLLHHPFTKVPLGELKITQRKQSQNRERCSRVTIYFFSIVLVRKKSKLMSWWDVGIGSRICEKSSSPDGHDSCAFKLVFTGEFFNALTCCIRIVRFCNSLLNPIFVSSFFSFSSRRLECF